MRELGALFLTFARIGACTFGGGYAMLPMLEREIVTKRHWATMDELLDYFAIGQCTPGIIAVNTATFVGYRRKGVVGGIAATLGMIFPSIVIILLIAALLSNFMDNAYVRYAFAGVRIAVSALIVGTIVKLAKTTVQKWWQALLAVLAFVVAALLHVNTIIPVFATIAGAVLCVLLTRGKGGEAS